MALRVPRRPDTPVPTRQQGYIQEVRGLDVTPITESIAAIRQKLDEDRRAQQKFQLNRRLMDEVNALTSDFEARKRDPSIGLDTFAETTNQTYDDRHRALTEELWQEGVDEDLLEEFDGRLATVRQGFFGNALGHQVGQLRARAEAEIDQYGVSASQLATSNPDAWPSVEEDIRETINANPYFTEAEKLALIDEKLGIARQGAGKAFALQRPGDVIQLLDPQGFTAPPTVGAVARSGAGASVDTAALVRDFEGFRESTYWDVNHHRVGYGSDTITEADGTVREVREGDRVSQADADRDLQRRLGEIETEFAGAVPNWATLGAGSKAALVSVMYNYGSFQGSRWRELGEAVAAGDPERIADFIESLKNDNGGVNAERRQKEADIVRADLTAAPTTPLASIPATTEPAVDPATTIAEVQTGVPILDALNGPERLQVLAWAREQQNRAVASQKAAMDVTIGNITAEALNNGGEIATPLPREEDVLAVYGPVEGPQRWAQIQRSVSTGKAIETFRTMSDTQIAAELTRLEPVPGTPTYETELQIYQAAERAAAALAEERERDPAAYAMKYFPSVGEAAEQGTAEYYAELDRVYQQLGIDPDYAAVLPAETMERTVQDYKVMTPAQRKSYIQSNFSAMGEDRFRRFVGGMEGTTAADDARIYALMRNYRGAPGEWDNIFTQVLEGREMIAQDSAKRPNPQVIREGFRSAAFAAINNLHPQASRAIQEAAVALYVFNGGHPTQFDARLYKQSLQTALGGSEPWNDAKGEVRDHTILPPKVTAAQFENWRDGLRAGDLTRLSVERSPPLYGDLKTQVLLEDIVDEGVFVMVSPGRYMIKMASDGKPLMTRSGRPFLVNVDTRTVR